MPVSKLPMPQMGMTVEDLTNIMFRYYRELEYVLGHLNSDNVKELDANITIIKNLKAGSITTQTFYADYGTIAQLTVDELNTAWEKIYNYLHGITADVNYIYAHDQTIDFITASTDGLSSVQLTDRDGNPLYWVDVAEHKGTTLEANANPVMIYVYTEMTKMQLSFKLVDGVYAPIITWGAGVGNLEHPDWGKGYIYKGSDGLHSKYITSVGVIQDVVNGESGIIQIGNIGAVGLRNIAVGTTAPTSPQNNDLWIDTDA
jgi:hypothetical protein